MDTKANKPIRLRAITTEKNTDYYLKVKSHVKEVKEAGMKNQFEQRFEETLQRIPKRRHSKGGVRQADKVHQPIGRAKERHCFTNFAKAGCKHFQFALNFPLSLKLRPNSESFISVFPFVWHLDITSLFL